MSDSPTNGGLGFTEAGMIRKLDQLTNTMQSIQTVAMWLMHHRKHSRKVCQIWLKELKKEKRSQKLVALVYLANDVIQNSRKKWPLYQEHFYPHLDKAFAHVAKYGDDKTVFALRKVVKVWKERSVYTKKLVDAIAYAVTSNLTAKQLSVWNGETVAGSEKQAGPSTPPGRPPATEGGQGGGDSSSSPSTPPPPHRRRGGHAASPPASPPGTQGPPPGRFAPLTPPTNVGKRNGQAGGLAASFKADDDKPLPTTRELLDALKKLQNPASADAHTRETIASFPESVANPSLLKSIKDAEMAEDLHKLIKTAEPVVSDYCKTLGAEMEHRRHTQQMLIDYVAGQQKQKAEALQDMLAQFRQHCDRLKADRIEIYKHYESLPDLSKLPNQTQLTPLPTVGDLFNRS